MVVMVAGKQREAARIGLDAAGSSSYRLGSSRKQLESAGKQREAARIGREAAGSSSNRPGSGARRNHLNISVKHCSDER